MRRREFLDQVRRLKGEGKSIRVIAAELDVHRSRVHRALTRMLMTRTPQATPSTGCDFGSVLWKSRMRWNNIAQEGLSHAT